MALARSVILGIAASALGATGVLSCASGNPGVTRLLPRGVTVLGGLDHYRIAGRTVAEIGASLGASSGPRGAIAHNWAYFRWSGRSTMGRSGCEITDLRVEVVSNIRMPEWERPADAPEELARQWDQYSGIVLDHERFHERLALEAAGEAVRAFEEIRDPSCMAVSFRADQEFERLMRDLREQQRFDRDERERGIGWPPRISRDSAAAARRAFRR